jgi:hypothetical protein
MLERLEERRLLTEFGIPWPEIDHLTLSFVPDGTMAGNSASDLFATLNSQMPTHEWEEDILQAFQTWAVQSNINIGLVSDGGQPFGTLGLKQSDPRFGDVRIGTFPMGADVLAVANPYNPFVASTLVGDVFLNSAYVFSDSGANSTYGLFSVALHEAGHVLGIGDSSDPNSAMFDRYHAPSSLSTTDVADLQALYGPRKANSFDGTLATATPLEFGAPGNEATSVTVAADISSLTDIDTYRLVAPQGSQSLTVSINVAGLSLLTPRMTALDASGTVLSTAVTTDPLNNNLSISLDQVKPGDTYYVQVSSGRSDVFGIGSYQLHVESHGLEPGVPDNTSPADATSGYNEDNYGEQNGIRILATTPGYSEDNYSEQNGIKILATTPGYVEHTYYELVDTVSPDWATWTYEVQSADIEPNLTNVMTVALNYSDNPDVKFTVTIRDDQGNLVASKTLDDSAGHMELQAMPIRSARDYFVTVRSYNPPADGATFDLRVDYSLNGNNLETYVSDSLSRDQYSVARTLQVIQSQEFDFVLGASDWGVPTQSGVRMEIADQDGQIVYTMSVADGALRSGDVFLNQGQYTVTFTRANEGVDTPVIFELSGLTTSDPLGPQLRDTIQEPLDSPTASAVPQLTFYWLPDDPNAAAAILASEVPRPSGQVRDSTDAPAAVTLSRETVNNQPQIISFPFAQQAQEPRIATAIVLESNRSNGTIASLDVLVTGASLRHSLLSPSAGQQTAGEEPVRSRENRPFLLPHAVRGSQKRKGAFADGTPPVVATASRVASERQPLVGLIVPVITPMDNKSRPLVEQAFAWLQSLDANDYATWVIAPLGATLGCLALKRVIDVRAKERLAQPRLERRDGGASHRRRSFWARMANAPQP